MGAIVAVIDKHGKTAAERAAETLETLTHRFNHSYGIATQNSLFMIKKNVTASEEMPADTAAIAYGLCKIKPKDPPQPIHEENFALILNGRFYPPRKPSDLEFAKTFLKKNPLKNAEELTEKIDGAYNVVVLVENRVVACRDPFGIKPLYYGENSFFAALASEKRALRKLGIEKAKPFPPGTLAVMSREGFSFKKVKSPNTAVLEGLTEDEAIINLQTLLMDAVKERTEDLNEFAIAFSGGIDSSLLALLAKKCGLTPKLISVGLENGKENEEAVSTAEKLNLPIKVKTFSEEEVEKIIPKVLWIIEEPNPLKLSIALPLFFAAETAKENGLNILFAGQGSDELFAGYKRYLQVFAEKGEKALHKALVKDFLNCHEANFERDEKICAFHNLELRIPYADWELAAYALRIPPNFKVCLGETPERKVILRKTAKKLGLPEFIANKPKKAIQYATGTASALKKIAKRKGLSIRLYVEKLFNQVYVKGESYE